MHSDAADQSGKILSEGLCHIVKSINGRYEESENESVESWRHRFILSDAHSLSESGKVVTGFDAPVRSSEELIRALRRGLCLPV